MGKHTHKIIVEVNQHGQPYATCDIEGCDYQYPWSEIEERLRAYEIINPTLLKVLLLSLLSLGFIVGFGISWLIFLV